MCTWKRLAVISLFGGAGFAVAVAGIVGAIAWYNSRPKQPRAWNTSAIVADGPPTFSAGDDGKKIEFVYSLQNKSVTDYQIDSASSIKLLVKTKDGTFSPPLSSEDVHLPIFVPAKQRAALLVSVPLPDFPEKGRFEFDGEYHERLRAYLNDRESNIDGFALFDDLNRYQIMLPRWVVEPPNKK
jgi:hypothetical protein